jgi:hypothetical protein
MHKLAFLLLPSLLGVPVPRTVVLRGAAQDCFQGRQEAVGGVSVTAFDFKQAGRLFAQLKRMDAASFAVGDTLAMARFDVQYSRMLALLRATPRLARAMSGDDGKFSFPVAATDSVLVVGYEEMEDEPYYYASAIVPSRASRSFILDMSRGGCAK